MPAKPKPIFVRYVAKDFLDGTQILTAMEELAYRRICDLIYVNDGVLVDDDGLAWATKTAEEWPAIRAALMKKKKIRIVRGKVVVKRCVEELSHVETVRKVKKKASKLAVSARKKARSAEHKTDTGKPNENNAVAESRIPDEEPCDAPPTPSYGSPNQYPVTKRVSSSSRVSTDPPTPSLEVEVRVEVLRLLTEADASWETREASLVRQWLADGCDPQTHIYPIIRRECQRGTVGKIRSLRYFTEAIGELRDSRPVAGPDPDAGTPRVRALKLANDRGDEPFEDRMAAAWGDPAKADRIGEQYLSDHPARTHGQAQEA